MSLTRSSSSRSSRGTSALRAVPALVCALGVVLVATGCGAGGEAGAGSSEGVAQVESIEDRLGTTCDDDTMGVKQAGTTIWCDPESGTSEPYVWVDAEGHRAAEQARQAEAAEQEETRAAAEKKAAERKAAAEKEAAERKAEQEAEAEREARHQDQDENVHYENCTAVRDAGAAPIHQGDPGYAKHLDRDGDGVGCE